jgi:hypothetical protein
MFRIALVPGNFWVSWMVCFLEVPIDTFGIVRLRSLVLSLLTSYTPILMFELVLESDLSDESWMLVRLLITDEA